MELPREWHSGWLPPGTPAPYSYECVVRCLNCQHKFDARATDELGATFVEPEECPECQSPNLELES